MPAAHGHRSPSRASARPRPTGRRSAQGRARAPRQTARHANNRKRRGSLWQRLRDPELRASAGAALRAKALPVVLLLGVTTGLAAAGYGGYRWLTTGETFRIGAVALSGQEQLSADQVTELLAIPADANMFRTDMGELERRLEANPWVDRASVSRDLPNRLQVSLEEHRAVAAVSLDGMYLVNEKGVPFKRANALEGELDGLIIITGVERDQFVAAPESWQEELSRTIRAAEEYASKGERPRLGEIHLDALHGPTFITYEQAIAIHVGQAELAELPERFQAFDAAWKALSDEQRQAARSLRIRNASPSDRVTVAFAGN